MAKKSGKALWVIGSFVVIGGAIAYFIWRSRKDKSTESSEAPPSTGEPSAYVPSSSGGSSGGSSSSSYSFPFKTTEEGNKFRKWVNDNYPDWAKKNKLDVSGSLNSYVDKAWKQYGEAYTKATSGGSATTTSQKKTYLYAKGKGVPYYRYFNDGTYNETPDGSTKSQDEQLGVKAYIGKYDFKTVTLKDFFGNKTATKSNIFLKDGKAYLIDSSKVYSQTA